MKQLSRENKFKTSHKKTKTSDKENDSISNNSFDMPILSDSLLKKIQTNKLVTTNNSSNIMNTITGSSVSSSSQAPTAVSNINTLPNIPILPSLRFKCLTYNLICYYIVINIFRRSKKSSKHIYIIMHIILIVSCNFNKTISITRFCI